MGPSWPWSCRWRRRPQPPRAPKGHRKGLAMRNTSGHVIDAVARPVDPTGVPNLDRVLGGGLPRGALTRVVGPPGSGKTTLAGQMAFAAARAGRRAVILTALSEPVSKLLAHMRTLAFYAEDLVGDRLQVLSLDQFRKE